MTLAALLAAAMILDAVLGEPDWLWSRFPHPAVLMGRAVNWLDQRLNSGSDRKTKGILATALLCVSAAAIGILLAALPGGPVIEVAVVAILLAQRSLATHVQAVADNLRLSTQSARDAVAKIVGRDTRDMPDEAIARAAIESAAENFSDGVIAPIFWFLLLGLPGILIYKIVNTADSMIGYKNDRYVEFGWAAARLDDLLNWIPARLSAALIALARWRLDAWPIIRRDAPLHRSPNAGWPESAMAVCVGISLAGPRSYNGAWLDFPWVYQEGRPDPSAPDVDHAVATLWRAWALALVLVAILAVV